MLSQSVFGALIVGTCLVCYYNSLNCGFVFDDISAIKENKDLRPHTPWRNIFANDFWGTPMQKEQSHKSYRPLCVLTFRWNYSMHGLDPGGYHLINMMLHCLVSLMYFKMCTMFLPELMSFVAAILFSVHPIHTEAVTGVVGRAETLSSVFFLAAFLSYVHATKQGPVTGWKQLLLSSAFVTTAMLCKEQGITVTGICAIYEIFVAQKIRLRDIQQVARTMLGGKSSASLSPMWPSEATKRLFVLCLSTVGLLFVRLQIMGSQLPVFTRFDNPASVAPTPARQLTYNYLVSQNLWLLLFPCNLCCDWTMGTVPIIDSLMDARNLATILSYLLIGVLVWVAFISENVQQTTVIIMGLSFMVLPYLPASNLFFPVGFVIAERILYMPSMGYCLLIAYGFHALIERLRSTDQKKLAWCCLGLVVLIHSTKTYTRNADWESEYSIFMSGLRVNKRNAKLFNNVGHALESAERYGEALNYFQTAVGVQQDDVGAHINVGRTYNHLKMFKEAEEAYLKAKSLLPKAKPGESYQARIAPNHLNVFLNLANLISKNHTRLEEADMLYRQAISMRADYTQAYINRGDILIKLNRTKEAQEVYERALLYDSTNPDIYYNLGVVFLEQGKASQALAYLDKALEFNPEHEQALLNSAILLQELGRADLRKIARERLLKLLSIDDKNERVYFNLGMLAMDDKNIEEAENWFKRAVHLKQDFRSALFNLALLLADDDRPLEAAPFLNQLVKYHPDHIKGLILLGDIYINNIKDLDAAENCYKRILQLDPVNIQGLHNLCVVYVERGRLLQAQACLKHAHELAPGEDYILRHLGIVQNRIAKFRQQQMQMQQQQQQAQYQQFHSINDPTGDGVVGHETDTSGHQQQHQQTHQYHGSHGGDWQQMQALEERQKTEKRKHHPASVSGGVNGDQVDGEQQQHHQHHHRAASNRKEESSQSPEAQSRGNKGNGGGHFSSSTSTETYDANGHNMAATVAAAAADVVGEPKANQSARSGASGPAASSPGGRSVQSPSSPAKGDAQQLNRDQVNPSSQQQQHSPNNHQQQPSHPSPSSVHDVNQKLEFTFANFDPRDLSSGGGADRLYLADDDHYSHEIKKNNALNQKFNNHHNYYGHHHQASSHYAGYDATAVVPGDAGDPLGVVVGDGEVDSLMMGYVDGSAHSVSGMIGRPGSSGGVMGGSSSVLIDKDLINDRKKPRPVAIGDSKFPPVNSKG